MVFFSEGKYIIIGQKLHCSVRYFILSRSFFLCQFGDNFLIVLEVLKKLDWVLLKFCQFCMVLFTSGRSGPGFGVNWDSNESASSSDFFNTKPLSPSSGCEAGCLFSRFLLIFYVELSEYYC